LKPDLEERWKEYREQQK
jgi:hypothetical protein